MRVYFVRHGESAGNANARGQTSGDFDQLTEKGWEQGRAVGKRLENEGLTKIITSHFRRARETAEAINETLRLPLEEHPGIHEHVQPESYYQQSHTDMVKTQPQFWMSEHDDDPDFSLNGGESFGSMVKRARDFQRFLVKHTTDDRLLVVSHKHFQRVFFGLCLFRNEFQPRHFAMLNSAMDTTNTGISIFDYRASTRDMEYPRKVWKLVTWMDRAHLE
jgi:broad specificity phosphatase PhoE